MDIGVHVFDLLRWWLGEPSNIEYFDDAMGGVEADCACHVEFGEGVTANVELSRTRNLSNSYTFRGEKGTLEVGTSVNPSIRLNLKNSDLDFRGRISPRLGVSDTAMADAFVRQLDDFVGSISERRNPQVSGYEGRRAVELIAECYASRRVLPQPWLFYQPSEGRP